MLWLLVAELRKLIRPLVWGTGLAITGFCLLITWGGVNNARSALAAGGVVAESVTVERPGLEDRFLEITRKEDARAVAADS